MENQSYDVVICGGGVAGLMLGVQLQEQMEEIRILFLEKEKGSLPTAIHKVGESTLFPLASSYLTEIGLTDYLDANHLHKYGLRYFLPPTGETFESRPEIGRSVYDSAIAEYQIDRGIFENDLREMVDVKNSSFIDGAAIQDIEINSKGLHQVMFKEEEGSYKTVSAKWVIDSTGRRRFLNRKFKLDKKIESYCSSAWFRVKGRVDVDDFVDSEVKEWHSRVNQDHPFIPNFGRYYSTNHLMGEGYWVWLIPLSSGNTSVGIVADERLIPMKEINSLERSMKWLEKNEQWLYNNIQQKEVLDFKMMRGYTHSASQVYSPARWACTGESGVFPDPFFSPGFDMISVSNSIITGLIKRDLRKGELDAEMVDTLSEEIIALSETYVKRLQPLYPFWGDTIIAASGVLWHITSGILFVSRLLRYIKNVDDLHLSREEHLQYKQLLTFGEDFVQFLCKWGELRKDKPSNCSYEFLDFFSIDFIRVLKEEITKSIDMPNERRMMLTKSLSLAFFKVSVLDLYPENIHLLEQGVWPEVGSFNLDITTWSKDNYDAEIEEWSNIVSGELMEKFSVQLDQALI